MFTGLVAIACGLGWVGKWAKEDKLENERRINAKAKYYTDKYGNLRVTATGKKINQSDFDTDWEIWNDRNAYNEYKIYVKRIELDNFHAERWWRHNPITGKTTYDPRGVLSKPVSFDEWKRRSGTAHSCWPKDEYIFDDYWYHLSEDTQKILLHEDL